MKKIKISESQFKEVVERLAEARDGFNPNRQQYVGAYLNKFRQKLNKPELTSSDLHRALQSGFFNMKPFPNGTYRKEDLDYVLQQGIGSLKRYFGLEDNDGSESEIKFEPKKWSLSPNPMNPKQTGEEVSDDPYFADMDNCSDTLLKQDEVFY